MLIPIFTLASICYKTKRYFLVEVQPGAPTSVQGLCVPTDCSQAVRLRQDQGERQNTAACSSTVHLVALSVIPVSSSNFHICLGENKIITIP